MFQNSHLLPKEVHPILHASHPGRELPQYLRFTKCETPFFVYFISQKIINVRTITPLEYSKVNLAGCDTSFFREITHLLIRDDTCSKLSHSMLPWYTAHDITDALTQQRLSYIFDQNYCPPHNIASCHIIQPLPSAEDWKAAYALD